MGVWASGAPVGVMEDVCRCGLRIRQRMLSDMFVD